MSEIEVELRQQNPEETDNMAQYESPDSEDVCASYISRNVSEQLGEYATLRIADDAKVSVDRTSDTKNYGVYDSPAEVLTGMYISHDLFDDEAPESINIALSPSDEEAFEDAGDDSEARAQEAEALVSGSESDDSDEGEQEVEISDEELGLTE